MKKNNEFAILRAIGALSVITIHTTSTYITFNKNSFSYVFFGSLNKFCNFAVPLFLFLSIVLLIKNTDNLNISTFFKKRFLKTVPIFLIYVVIYYIYLKFSGKTLISITQSPLKFFNSYILQGGIYHHFYFMPLIFELYILFPFIYFITKKIKNIHINPIISFILSFGILTLLQFGFQIIHKYYIWPYYQNPAIILFTYLLPIGMGIWVGINYETFIKLKIIKILALIIAGISGYFLIRYSLFPTIKLHNLVLPIYTASVSIVLLTIAIFINNKFNSVKQICYKIGKYSFTIYLIHPLILDIYRKKVTVINFTQSAFLNNFIHTGVKFIIVFGVSYMIAWCIEKIKNIFYNSITKIK